MYSKKPTSPVIQYSYRILFIISALLIPIAVTHAAEGTRSAKTIPKPTLESIATPTEILIESTITPTIEIIATSLPPTATSLPTVTPEPPTPTSEPPTPTSLPSATSTVIVPTMTSIPNVTSTPTATNEPSSTSTVTPNTSPTATASQPTATSEPSATSEPTQVPTVTATSTPLPDLGDDYENDAPPYQVGYAGPQQRTFAPQGDVDYVRYRLKANLLTWFETTQLQGAADTQIEVYHDEDGTLTRSDTLLGRDDDSGSGFGSLLSLQKEQSMWLTIVIRQRGAGWGPNVGYTLRITTSEQQTPTPAPPEPGDEFESDEPPHAPSYAGAQRHTFDPAGDVDYVRYRMKSGLRVWFETSGLTAAADTELLIYHDEDGILLNDPLLTSDDDGGDGLGSRATLKTNSDLWVTIVIRNRSAAWGENVGYTLRIITALEATPTVTNTPRPTHTPTVPIPTATATRIPRPTVTPTATSTPTIIPTVASVDQFELDDPPNAPGYTGPQIRSFSTREDLDYVRYRMKAGVQVWFETKQLTGAADTELLVYRDDDSILGANDPLLASDDDSGEGLGSYATLKVEQDMWVTIVIRNRSSGWGPKVGYVFEIVTEQEMTPTPTLTPTPSPTFTSTPKPTETARPLPTKVVQVPTVPKVPPKAPPEPTRVAPKAPIPQVPTQPPPKPQVPTPAPPNEEPTVTVTSVPTKTTLVPSDLLRVDIFMDINQDGVMNWGEGVNDVLVYLTTTDRTWQTEAYTTDGEALIPLAGLPENQDLLILVPYLHRSANLKIKGTNIESQIDLNLPTYPSYLP